MRKLDHFEIHIRCFDGLRCRRHCEYHCYDDNGNLWPDHDMFCGETVEPTQILKGHHEETNTYIAL